MSELRCRPKLTEMRELGKAQAPSPRPPVLLSNDAPGMFVSSLMSTGKCRAFNHITTAGPDRAVHFSTIAAACPQLSYSSLTSRIIYLVQLLDRQQVNRPRDPVNGGREATCRYRFDFLTAGLKG